MIRSIQQRQRNLKKSETYNYKSQKLDILLTHPLISNMYVLCSKRGVRTRICNCTFACLIVTCMTRQISKRYVDICQINPGPFMIFCSKSLTFYHKITKCCSQLYIYLHILIQQVISTRTTNCIFRLQITHMHLIMCSTIIAFLYSIAQTKILPN